MRLTIRHETIYRYSTALAYSIQKLLLTPRIEAHQRIVQWDMVSDGRRHPFVDAYGNRGHILTLTGKHDRVRVEVRGTVDIDPLFLGRLEESCPLSPLVFGVSTPLTEVTAAVAGFAAQHIPAAPHSDDLLRLADAVRSSVVYQGGVTDVDSTADDALRLGRGVCQDHAHLFIACCHAQGILARYVSGYIDPGATAHAASHAWVDVWVTQSDYQGWVSVDVTNGLFASDNHCRLAIGRDYESAAPIRGNRRGGGDESLTVSVRVAPLWSTVDAAQQQVAGADTGSDGQAGANGQT